MRIGILQERKQDERRVGLVPAQVRELVQSGHSVWVETGAGQASGYNDAAYSSTGASVVEAKDVYDNAVLLIKVKCPLPEEYSCLNDSHILFTYLHFDENIPPDKILQIVDTGVTGIAYEWVREGDCFPLLKPMSELTGAVFARKAMSLLMEHAGVLGGQYLDSWPIANCMIIGCGKIGANAINVLLRNRFNLTVVDKNPHTIEDRISPYVDLSMWSQANVTKVRFDEDSVDESLEAIRTHLPEMHIVICSAVRRSTFTKDKCEYIIKREDIASMRRNSVICDATACDRDFIETCVSSESVTETYAEEGVIHYNCDHIPSLVPNTATTLLTAATFPYVKLLAEKGIGALSNAALFAGTMCHKKKLTHEYSARKKQMSFVDLQTLL